MRSHQKPGLRGEKNPKSRLTDDDVRIIRRLFTEGKELPLAERRRRGLDLYGLAEKFEVSSSCIACVVYYRSWTHIY